MTEHQEQVAFINWFRTYYPHVLIHSIPNGGNRNIITAKMLKSEGAVAGIPDLFIPAFNLWVEMKKAIGGKLSDNQKNIIYYLENEAKHTVIIGYGAIDASNKTKEFISGKV
jgi:hypothetical protein